MNLSISSSLIKTFAIFLGVLGVAAAIAIAGFARAEAGPVVGLNVRDTNNAVVASAPIGATLYASTTVASSTQSTNPTGTVNFSWWQNMSCAGTASVQSAVALVGGSATSSTTTMPATGLSYKVHYNGDATNTPSDSQCVAVAPTSALAAIHGTLSTSTVLAGSSVFASATLSGLAGNASGTVAYTAYTNSSCTAGAMSAGSFNVSAGAVPNSNALAFGSAGTYYWQAVYSGDAQNNAATSTCGSMVLSVLNPSAPTTTPVALGSIFGVSFNDLNQDRAQSAGEPGIAGMLLVLRSAYGASVLATTTTSGNGTYSFANLAMGTYVVSEAGQPGWKQISGNPPVVLSSTSPNATLNFANVTRATSTRDHDDDDADDQADAFNVHIHFNFGQLVSFLRHSNGHGNDHGDHGNHGKGKALGHEKHDTGDGDDD